MNDFWKKRIIIGILAGVLCTQAGCGRKEITFVQAEESRMAEAGAGENNTGMYEETGKVQNDEAYTIRDGQAAGLEETEASQSIFVYVCGAVVSPGVYELEENARAFQAVEKAGGFSEDAYKEALNLAKPLEDGEQLFIPTKEEWEEKGEIGQGIKANETEDDGLVNINTASKEELCTLNGVGEARAESIIAYREEKGGFSSIEEIKNVSGIKDGLFEKIKDKIKTN